MFNPNTDGPCSPLKKLKILSVQQQNVQYVSNNETVKLLKESSKKCMDKISENQIEEIKEKVEVVVEKESELDIEPLLRETSNQYVIFPINHDDMWSMYKELVGNFWSVTETLENLDALDLDYNEKKYMKLFSSVFSSPDSRGLVNENFAEEFCKLIQVTEAKFFFGHQLFVQNIHYEMYNKLLDSYAHSNEEKETLFKIVENYDSVAEKRAWLSQWKNSHFSEQLMAALCLHGLFFSAIELTANWLKKRSRSNGSHELVEIFDKILHDQELQRDFACLMISHLKHKPSNQRILETINQAAKIEFSFLLNGLNIDLIGVGAQDVLEIIDKNTKTLKTKIFSTFEEKKKTIQTDVQNKANDANNMKMMSSKENHQKLVFDEDF
jgi:ribonucleotide reductase beta subunit family protein with ferritin-like domain